MSKKIVVGLTAALALLIGTGVMMASAKHCKDKPGHKGMGGDESNCLPCERKENPCFYLENKEVLGLNEDQVSKMKALKVEAKKTKIHNFAEIDILMLDINALLDEKKPNLTEINAKIDKVSQLKAETMKNCFKTSVAAREILTEEQKQLAEGMKKACVMPQGHPDVDDEKPPCKKHKAD